MSDLPIPADVGDRAPLPGDSPPVAGVQEVSRGRQHDLRGMKIVWRREMIRFARDPLRMVTQLTQPVLYLFVLGTGLSALAAHSRYGGHVSFRTFMYPGIISMTVLFTSMFSAMSIVWDREFGFLREMLVAPIRRWAIILGKCLGGTTVATVQALLILALAGAVGVPYSPLMIVELIGEMVLAAFALNAFGVMVASRIKQIQAFQWVMNFMAMPMFFLSGAVYPLSTLPTWLTVLTRSDPLAYAVDPLRRTIFERLAVSPRAMSALNPGITWNGWRLPTAIELAIVGVFAAVMALLAIVQFSRTD